MLGLLTGVIEGAVAPLLERFSKLSAALFRKMALFVVAGLCTLVVVSALTHAFDLWITTLAGPIIGSLAVAGVYLLIALIAILSALRRAPPSPSVASEANDEARRQERAFDSQVDQFSAPLLKLLRQFGLKRELIAVLAGTSVAKRLGPLPLVGLAIVSGFLIGRMWKTWRGLLTSEAIMGAVSALGLFGSRMAREPEDDATVGR